MTFKLTARAGWIVGAAILLLSLWILQSFVVPLAWASIVAVASWPVYRRFADRLPRRFASNLTPLLFTVLVTLSVLGPVLFAFGALVAQGQAWAHQLIVADREGLALPGWLEEIPLFGTWLAEHARDIGHSRRRRPVVAAR
jgi:predicted PurR-regulated permease PerM